MSLVFERIHTEGIAALSYLLGDDRDGCAAVFDPTPDIDKFVALARQKRVVITHIFETHIHADFVSGERELAACTASARVFTSHEGGACYDFDHEQLWDGDVFAFGNTVVTARHTPGHTPEHLSYLLAAKDHPEMPWGVLSGDSLFVGSAGRPDLLGSDETDQLTHQLFDTLRGFYLSLPEAVMLYPAHGHGSPCGADIGDRLESTIGYERRFNPYLQMTDFAAFKQHALRNAPPVPSYYPRMKKVNAEGPDVMANLPRVPGLRPQEFAELIRKGSGTLIDTRNMLAFGGGHISGALNIGASPMLSIWAGWLLDPTQPILLVLDDEAKLDMVVKLFIRTGYTKFSGYLAGGMQAWDAAGLPIDHAGQMSVHEVYRARAQLQIVDVRAPAEWQAGHVAGAVHLFVADIPDRAMELDRSKPTAVYCDSGYRASIAVSLLKQRGFECVSNVPGSWQAWKSANLPISDGEKNR